MRNFFLIILMSIGLLGSAYALPKKAHAPVMHYQNFDTLTITLSSSDLNTIVFQQGNQVEKIIDLMGGANLYHAQRDSIGQVYLTVKADAPFTLFVTTNKHHHIALHIKPSNSQGQTLVFAYGQKKTIHKSKRVKRLKPVSIQQRLHQLAMHQLPASFHLLKTKNTTQTLKHGLRLKRIQVYSNHKVRGVIYALQNTASKNQRINPRALLNKRILGIRLDKRVVPAHGAIWCYRWEKV